MNTKSKESPSAGTMIRRYRHEQNYTQAEMANILGISQQQYSVIERDAQEPSLEFIQKFRLHTGVNLLSKLNEVDPEEHQQLKQKNAELIEELKQSKVMVQHLMEENFFLRELVKNGGVVKVGKKV